jgi:hypothetical protein
MIKASILEHVTICNDEGEKNLRLQNLRWLLTSTDDGGRMFTLDRSEKNSQNRIWLLGSNLSDTPIKNREQKAAKLREQLDRKPITLFTDSQLLAGTRCDPFVDEPAGEDSDDGEPPVSREDPVNSGHAAHHPTGQTRPRVVGVERGVLQCGAHRESIPGSRVSWKKNKKRNRAVVGRVSNSKTKTAVSTRENRVFSSCRLVSVVVLWRSCVSSCRCGVSSCGRSRNRQ